MKLWIVTAVDHGDSCDGKARVLGAFKSYGEARNYVNADIQEWVDHNTDELRGCGCSFAEMAAWYEYDDAVRCEWNIEEVEAK